MEETTGTTGRNAKGQFVKGNRESKGRRVGATVDKLRRALLTAVKESDVKAIVRELVTQAKGGNIAAAKVIFERTLGQPVQTDLIERLEALEAGESFEEYDEPENP